MRVIHFALVLLLGTCASSAQAAIRYVALCGNDAWSGTAINCIGPTGPKKTIQAAINSSANGDTVIVLAGSHVGAIDMDGKAITLISASGPAFTELTRNGEGPIILCNSLEGSGTVIQGFAIRDGFSIAAGAGLRCALSQPTIIDCWFDQNVSFTGGAGVSTYLASPTFIDCDFTNNMDILPVEGVQGGAVLVELGHPTFENCTFVNNHASDLGGAVALVNNASADFLECHFQSNETWVIEQSTGGAAIGCVDSTVLVDDCSFHFNNAAGEGGALFLDQSTATVQLSSFEGNIARHLHGGGIRAVESDVTLAGCEFIENRSNGYGAALTAVFSQVSIALCTFQDNGQEGADGVGPSTRGGAIWVSYSDTSIVASAFNGNSSSVDGGALTIGGFPYDDDETTISGCTFFNNASDDDGGAIAISNGNATISGSNFSSNDAHFGGAIRAERSSDDPSYPPSFVDLFNCTFENNTAFTGGGVYIRCDGAVHDCEFNANEADNVAGGLDVVLPAVVMVSDCSFDQNHATSGGAMAASSTGCTVVDCTFTNNTAWSGGALISTVSTQRPRVHRSTFAYNTAETGGAAIAVGSASDLLLTNAVIHHNTAIADGGAIWLFSGSIDIANCTIANNVGGGVFADQFAASASVVNSIVWGNTSGAEVADLSGSALTVRYSNVQGGTSGEGNINVSPKFVGALGGNYRLLPTSACIDAGMNWLARVDESDLDEDGLTAELTPVDRDGMPRFAESAVRNDGCGLGAVVDLGAYEAPGVPAGNLLFADLDGDGLVGAPDLAILLGAWGVGTCIADLDGDGTVNAGDLAILLGAWG